MIIETDFEGKRKVFRRDQCFYFFYFIEVFSSMILRGKLIGLPGMVASNLIGEVASIVVFRVMKSSL